MNTTPVIPDTAPFSPEQRIWLNGYMAGVFSYSHLRSENQIQAKGDKILLVPLTILYGSQTGTAESLAKQAAKFASTQQFVPAVYDMAAYKADNLKFEKNLLIITSTYGDGEPPDNAITFWEALKSLASPLTLQLNYSVFALGDTKYEKFCKFGKDCDRQFEESGANRIYDFTEADVDYEEIFQKWIRGVLDVFGKVNQVKIWSEGLSLESGIVFEQKKFDKKKPYMAKVIKNQLLTGYGSLKETRHFEISLEDDDLAFEPGDALAVMPKNNQDLVTETLSALQIDENTEVEIAGKKVSARDAFSDNFDLRVVKKELVTLIAERTKDKKNNLLSGMNEKLNNYLTEFDLVDIFRTHPEVRFSLDELLPLLKPLQPRLYSIASSWKAFPRQAHLTVAIVRYEFMGRLREGTCSTYLANKSNDVSIPVYVHTNTAFRLPSDGNVPIIMVGPGTGVAPFRAFLQDRLVRGDTGKNVLFFGEKHEASCFFYREEFGKMLSDRFLEMYTAFSRDQDQKVYVQQRILENRVQIYDLLQEGGYFYVCGDAERMGRDVDDALIKVIETVGQKTVDEARDYVQKLRLAKRYQRDVY